MHLWMITLKTTYIQDGISQKIVPEESWESLWFKYVLVAKSSITVYVNYAVIGTKEQEFNVTLCFYRENWTLSSL